MKTQKKEKARSSQAIGHKSDVGKRASSVNARGYKRILYACTNLLEMFYISGFKGE